MSFKMPSGRKFWTDDSVKICQAPDHLLQLKDSFAGLESQQSSMWLFPVQSRTALGAIFVGDARDKCFNIDFSVVNGTPRISNF